jgi:hypothetical protein
MSLLAMATQTGKPLPQHFKVDTDSNTIGIDNRCSACISDRLEDFLYPPQPCQRTIKGFGASKNPYIWVSLFPAVCNSQPYNVNKRIAFL